MRHCRHIYICNDIQHVSLKADEESLDKLPNRTKKLSLKARSRILDKLPINAVKTSKSTGCVTLEIYEGISPSGFMVVSLLH